MVTFGQNLEVEHVQGAGTPAEKKSRIMVGGNLNDTALFKAKDVMPKVGDEINRDDFSEPRVVTDVATCRASGRVTHYMAELVSKSKHERLTASVSPPVQQTVHGNVGQMAGHDINIDINISASDLIAVLESAVEQDDALSEEHKSSIMETLTQVKDNTYFERISSSLISSAMWAFITLCGGGES